LQSNYIPWKGYFDLINKVDEFILFDDTQYTKRDWRNRNKIKTKNGIKWLTIPVSVKGKYLQKIKETKIIDENWNKQHWQIIKSNYSKSRYYKDYNDVFEELYLNCSEKYLSIINYKFIITINNILNINTKIRFSNEFDLIEGQTEKLLDICKQCDADTYISGPSAKKYFNEDLALQEDIKVEWMDYDSYPLYNQLYLPFNHEVSILDLIFNEGANATKFLKSFNNEHRF